MTLLYVLQHAAPVSVGVGLPDLVLRGILRRALKPLATDTANSARREVRRATMLTSSAYKAIALGIESPVSGYFHTCHLQVHVIHRNKL